MALEINKLKSLYLQLDCQKAAGEDVVAELKKEINNLELSYLKEQVLPQVAQFLASKVRNLRCGIDSSFQFDGQQNINYSFCTSGSMLFVKDTLDVNSVSEISEPFLPYPNFVPSSESESYLSSETTKKSLRLVDYSEKAVALFGDTKDFSEELKRIGGYFNPRLRGGMGWIFPKKKKEELIALFSSYLQDFNSTSTKTEIDINNPISSDNPKLSTEKWINLILSMKCMKHKGFIAPHKAVFMLTMIEAIRNNKLIENRIFPSTSLSGIFNSIWSQYVSTDLPFNSNFFQPFIHMEGEPYYNLVKVEGVDRFDINQSWNRSNVIKYVEYGVFDNELFSCLSDENFSSTLKSKLIEKYLSQHISPNDSYPEINLIEEKQEDDKDIFIGFSNYLRTLKSNKGKPYSESSINVFQSALKSKYFIEKLSNVSGYKNLGTVNDIKIINKVLSILFYDYENGFKNKITYQALKMYKDYLKQNILDKFINEPVKYTIDESNVTSPKIIEKVEDKSIPNKIVEIKSIHSEDIFIEGKDSENIFLDFINQVGPDLVRQMNINYLGANIIDNRPHLFYSDHCKPLSDGSWVNVSARPKTLANHIIKICNNLNMFVEIEINIGSRIIKIDNKNSII